MGCNTIKKVELKEKELAKNKSSIKINQENDYIDGLGDLNDIKPLQDLDVLGA